MTKNNTSDCAQCADGGDFCVVGVDVSKKHLDAHELPSGRSKRFKNSKAGIRALRRWVCPRVRWVVYESTGSYHLPMEDAMAGDLPLSRQNPKRVKHFAKAVGMEAKTDRVDALALARMGRTLADGLERTAPRSEWEKKVHGLCVARRAEAKAKSVLKCRLEHTELALVRREIKRDIERKKRLIARYDAELERLAAENPEFSRKVGLLTSIKGVRAPTAIALLSEMPELGTLTSRQAASLAGLAPVACDSGERRGQRSVKNGRKRARTALYMSAMSAVRWVPSLREAHNARTERGMKKKASLIAVMRKLVVIANAILRDGEPFRDGHVCRAPSAA